MADFQAMQEILADVQRTDTLDQASRDRLLLDLRETDRSLWPLVVQQFRAALAYRQQAQQRRLSTTASATPAVAAAPGQAGQSPTVAPAISQCVPAPQAAPGVSGPSGPPQAGPSASPAPAAAPQAKASPSGEVVPVSYVAGSDPADPWLSSLKAALRANQSQLAETPKTPRDEARQVQVRLLQLLAGQRDDALKPISAASAEVQAFWAEELYGLAVCLDTEHTTDSSRRSAEAKQHLADALAKLGATCPLSVRNLAFCSRIQSYGCITQFDHYDFTPGQRVLLYAEVENLSSEAKPQGIHTSLRASYLILDSRGQRVAEDEFTVAEEYCRNVRRDYFVGYEIHLPDRIYPGKHTLKLMIEDLKSRKFGESSIEFTIKKG